MRQITERILRHPVVVAVCEDSLRKWVCRVLGHQWIWPEVIVSFNFDTGFVELNQRTSCARCGCDAPSEFPTMMVHFHNLSPNWVCQVPEDFGAKVKKEMGWK